MHEFLDFSYPFLTLNTPRLLTHRMTSQPPWHFNCNNGSDCCCLKEFFFRDSFVLRGGVGGHLACNDRNSFVLLLINNSQICD